jgi:predicted DsbA family dithiol-disulfide isomerase
VIVDIVSDVVCPWCFVGRRKLEAALASWRGEGRAEPAIRWHPFELNPGLPQAGVARDDYVRGKFGDRAGEIYARVARAGEAVGIGFAFDRIVRQPNTRRSHQLIAAAETAGVQDAVARALFEGYFVQGADLTSDAVLAAIAAGAGLAPETAAAALEDEGLAAQVEAAEERARTLGITGVPFFVFDGRVAVSGAQDPDVLLQAMRQAVAT